jgi:hypothetical protein
MSGSPSIHPDHAIHKIGQHVEKYLGPIVGTWNETANHPPYIDLLHIDPTESRPFHYLVTSGMSDLAMKVPAEEGFEEYRFIELVLALPASWPMEPAALAKPEHFWPIGWLRRLARFPHDTGQWLGWGHTIPVLDPPRPFVKGSCLTTFLIARPRLVDPLFWTLSLGPEKTGAERTIHFFGLFTISESELQFKLDQGTDLLLEHLHQAGACELLDLYRPNTV